MTKPMSGECMPKFVRMMRKVKKTQSKDKSYGERDSKYFYITIGLLLVF